MCAFKEEWEGESKGAEANLGLGAALEEGGGDGGGAGMIGAAAAAAMQLQLRPTSTAGYAVMSEPGLKVATSSALDFGSWFARFTKAVRRSRIADVRFLLDAGEGCVLMVWLRVRKRGGGGVHGCVKDHRAFLHSEDSCVHLHVQHFSQRHAHMRSQALPPPISSCCADLDKAPELSYLARYDITFLPPGEKEVRCAAGEQF